MWNVCWEVVNAELVCWEGSPHKEKKWSHSFQSLNLREKIGVTSPESFRKWLYSMFFVRHQVPPWREPLQAAGLLHQPSQNSSGGTRDSPHPKHKTRQGAGRWAMTLTVSPHCLPHLPLGSFLPPRGSCGNSSEGDWNSNYPERQTQALSLYLDYFELPSLTFLLFQRIHNFTVRSLCSCLMKNTDIIRVIGNLFQSYLPPYFLSFFLRLCPF